MTEAEVETRLEGVLPGTEVFVSYVAGGRAPTARAMFEATKADNLGYSRRWMHGQLHRVFRNKRGELAVCVFTYGRYNADNPEAEGHYRTFNPSLGAVLTLEVLQ